MRISDIHKRMLSQVRTDADSLAFFQATGITNTTIQEAVNDLVVGLKTNNIWNKIKAVYPFVGGTENTHKFNLKDPRNLNAAFRLQFFGGWTHSANGVMPNGSTGYANTFFIPSQNIVLGFEHQLLYSTTNNTPLTIDSVDIGAFNILQQSSLVVIKGTGSKNLFGGRMNSQSVDTVNTDARGLFLLSKNGGNLRIFKNNLKVKEGVSGGSLPTVDVFIGTLNIQGNPYNSGRTNQNYAFASIGGGLTDADALVYYNLVQSFQTKLGRQV